MPPDRKAISSISADQAENPDVAIEPAEFALSYFERNPPSARALKILPMLISHAGARISEDVVHEMRVSDLNRRADWSSQDWPDGTSPEDKRWGMRRLTRHDLAAAVGELDAVGIERWQGEDRVAMGGYINDPVIDWHEDGHLTIRWRFSDRFRELAAEDGLYARINVALIRQMRSRYSIQLMRHLGARMPFEKKSPKVVVPLPELRKMLGVPPGRHEFWHALWKHALKPACDDISARSPWIVRAEPHRRGRAVAYVTLHWKLKDGRRLRAAALHTDAGKIRDHREFPAAGPIQKGGYWHGIKTSAGCNMDNLMFADKVRKLCREKGVDLQSSRMAPLVRNLAAKIGKV